MEQLCPYHNPQPLPTAKLITPGHKPIIGNRASHDPDADTEDPDENGRMKPRGEPLARNRVGRAPLPMHAPCIRARFGGYVISATHSLERSGELVKASYQRKGYTADHTLVSTDIVFDIELSDRIVGTLTMRLDSPERLYGDMTYPDELNALRLSGRKLAELSRFVILPGQPTSTIMGAFFHLIYVYGYLMNDVTDLICEVVPQHVAAQGRLLGFMPIAGPRLCRRAGIDAFLLHRTLAYPA
ncbi:hypothetical protein SAMN05216414_10980 [Nitrosovibrio sp. Nv17]|nr:hypothetical protein SAMN05216414_10980 [Nitrosovibrio sp. Nv17]